MPNPRHLACAQRSSLLLGGLFLLLGALVPPVVRWAARTREVAVAPEAASV
ncbi:hypothetical protein [Micromonospora sp. NPDC048830]|uniref:hypothetical protein n=1 Tax=Micromonospora sp. NPDC048830 TaxID=3364257 RepID=UPI003712E136